MEILHPQYVVDGQGIPRSVVLEIAEFRNLIRSAGIQADKIAGSEPSSLSSLGWTAEEIQDTSNRLCSFQEDWGASGMEAYDNL
jgi:hypothetical protein